MVEVELQRTKIQILEQKVDDLHIRDLAGWEPPLVAWQCSTAVPAPSLCQLLPQGPLKTLDNVPSKYWKKLPAMQRAASGHPQPRGVRVWGDDEIMSRSHCVPIENRWLIRVSRRYLGIAGRVWIPISPADTGVLDFQ